MNTIPDFTKQLYPFLMVVGSAFIIGLEQAKIHAHDKAQSPLFGSHRTFTFIGLLGFILFNIGNNQVLFLGGGLALTVFLGIFYYFKISKTNDHGLTSVVLGILVYCLAPMFTLLPIWISLSVLVLVLVLSELKEQLNVLTQKIGNEEFITFSKFIVLSGIIIPVLPNTPVVSFIDTTPREVWVAVVVISGISYVSYLLKRYVFPNSGTVLTGILGGFYSSTATTIVLSRQSKLEDGPAHQFASAILFATMAMYIRLQILAFIFNINLALQLFPYIGLMIALCAGTAYLIMHKGSEHTERVNLTGTEEHNPLQIKMSLIFALLFVGLSLVTHFALQKFGASGMNLLSWIVGFADIDPFLLNLFQGKLEVSQKILILATLQAITSNNLLKALYARSLSGHKTGTLVFKGFAVIFGACLLEIAWVAILG